MQEEVEVVEDVPVFESLINTLYPYRSRGDWIVRTMMVSLLPVSEVAEAIFNASRAYFDVLVVMYPETYPSKLILNGEDTE